MLSSPEADSISHEKNLSETYVNFVHVVVKVCTENATGIPAFFRLNYIRIEFAHMIKLKSSDKMGKNMITEVYLNNGIQIIDCALEWLEYDNGKSKTINQKKPV